MWQPQKDRGQALPVGVSEHEQQGWLLSLNFTLLIFRHLYLGGARYSHSPLHALTNPTAAALPAVQAHISSQSHKQGNLVLFISLSRQGLLFLSRQPKFSRWGVWHKTSSTCLLFLLFTTWTQLVLHSFLNIPFFCPPWFWWIKLWEPQRKNSHPSPYFQFSLPLLFWWTGEASPEPKEKHQWPMLKHQWLPFCCLHTDPPGSSAKDSQQLCSSHQCQATSTHTGKRKLLSGPSNTNQLCLGRAATAHPCWGLSSSCAPETSCFSLWSRSNEQGGTSGGPNEISTQSSFAWAVSANQPTDLTGRAFFWRHPFLSEFCWLKKVMLQHFPVSDSCR